MTCAVNRLVVFAKLDEWETECVVCGFVRRQMQRETRRDSRGCGKRGSG